jgi:HlyD family secretion protein
MTDSDAQRRADLTSLRIERSNTALPRRRRSGGRGRWLIGAAVFAVAAVAAVWLFGSRTQSVTVVSARRTEAAQLGPIPVLSGSGYIVTGERYVSVGVRVAGRIDRYFVEEGQTVHKGDPLVQLDDRDYQAAVARTESGIAVARANLALANSELHRGRELRGQRVISQQELDVLQNKADVARATLAQLEAELAQAKVSLEYTLLRAPTDGVVLAKLKEVGEIAVPGGFAGSGDLIRLANLNDMRAEVDVNEADLTRVRMGQAAQVTPDAYPDQRYAARVVKLYPQVDRQKGTLKTEVQILNPDDKLLPDMSARVTFLDDTKSAARDSETVVLVPSTAVHRDALGVNFVWVVIDGRARQQPVDTAGDVGNQVRIAGGLQGGETVVVGDVTLREGQRVSSTPSTP